MCTTHRMTNVVMVVLEVVLPAVVVVVVVVGVANLLVFEPPYTKHLATRISEHQPRHLHRQPQRSLLLQQPPWELHPPGT